MQRGGQGRGERAEQAAAAGKRPNNSRKTGAGAGRAEKAAGVETNAKNGCSRIRVPEPTRNTPGPVASADCFYNLYTRNLVVHEQALSL